MPWQAKENLIMWSKQGILSEDAMDREDKFFLLSLFSLAVCLFLFPLALYLLPQAWLGWIYHTPDFAESFSEYFQVSLGVPQEAAQWVVINILFISGSVFAVVAYYAARQVKLDHKKRPAREKVDEAEVRLRQTKHGLREVMTLLVKIAVIVFVVVIISNIMQWAMSVAG